MPADKEWAQLNADQFAAAKLLGYSKASWYEPAPPQRVEWTQLSEEELSAAKLLGWDEDLWANELEAAGEVSSDERLSASGSSSTGGAHTPGLPPAARTSVYSSPRSGGAKLILD